MGLRNYLDVAQYVGINSILYGIPSNVKEEAIIDDFKQSLGKKMVDLKLLREWYINMQDFVLKFIIRTEANWRFSLKLFEQLFKDIIEGKPKNIF